MDTTLRSGIGDWCLILSVLALVAVEVVAGNEPVKCVSPLVLLVTEGAGRGTRWALAVML